MCSCSAVLSCSSLSTTLLVHSPTLDPQLSDRLEEARREGDEDREKHLLMQRAAAGQDAATDPEE